MFARVFPWPLAFLAALAAAQTDVIISVSNFSFTPDPVTVNVGDTLTFQWVSGSHTATSGLSSQPQSRPGALFDAPMTSGSPTFNYRVTSCGENGNGAIPYFCRPHESFMRGQINVNPVLSRSGTPRPGATVTFALQVAAEAGRSYVMAGSLGSAPGMEIAGRRIVPLNPDILFLSSAGQNNQTFSGFIGTLDGTGAASPAPLVRLPALSGLIGIQLFFASVTINPAAPGQIGSISNSVNFVVQP